MKSTHLYNAIKGLINSNGLDVFTFMFIDYLKRTDCKDFFLSMDETGKIIFRLDGNIRITEKPEVEEKEKNGSSKMKKAEEMVRKIEGRSFITADSFQIGNSSLTFIEQATSVVEVEDEILRKTLQNVESSIKTYVRLANSKICVSVLRQVPYF